MDNRNKKGRFEKGFKVLRLWEREIKTIELNDFKNKLRQIENRWKEYNKSKKVNK